MLPDFIIIGAMKAGTSSLFKYVASHPDILGSSIKETNYFKTITDFNKGVSWYKSLFQGNGKYAIEASPNYTKCHIFPGVPARMHSILPEVKLIYSLRDPIDRVISHYVHNVAHGRESRPISEALSDKHNNMIRTSQYHSQIQAFLEYYTEDQILIIQSEKLRNDTVEILSDVFSFLGVSNEPDMALIRNQYHKSKNKTRPSRLERSLCQMKLNPYLLKQVKQITKPFRKSIRHPTLSDSDKEFLLEEIGPDTERLRKFTGLKFADWSI